MVSTSKLPSCEGILNCGANQKYVPAIADNAVESAPGQNPPNQELTATAGKNAIRGYLDPNSGQSAAFANAASTVMTIETTYGVIPFGIGNPSDYRVPHDHSESP